MSNWVQMNLLWFSIYPAAIIFQLLYSAVRKYFFSFEISSNWYVNH